MGCGQLWRLPRAESTVIRRVCMQLYNFPFCLIFVTLLRVCTVQLCTLACFDMRCVA